MHWARVPPPHTQVRSSGYGGSNFAESVGSSGSGLLARLMKECERKREAFITFMSASDAGLRAAVADMQMELPRRILSWCHLQARLRLEATEEEERNGLQQALTLQQSACKPLRLLWLRR